MQSLYIISKVAEVFWSLKLSLLNWQPLKAELCSNLSKLFKTRFGRVHWLPVQRRLSRLKLLEKNDLIVIPKKAPIYRRLHQDAREARVSEETTRGA